MRAAAGILLTFSLFALPRPQTSEVSNGLSEYEDANYEAALPLLRAAAGADPKNAAVRAALLSSLTYEGKVDEAEDVFDSAATDFPDSAEVLAARGEFTFYMGDVYLARKLFGDSLKVRETARAVFGLSHMLLGSSMYRTGRIYVMRAHELDPKDALIMQAWIPYLTLEMRREVFGPFRNAHPWLYKHAATQAATSSEIRSELNRRKIFELDAEPKETTLHLIPLMISANKIYGMGLEFTIENGKRMTMLLDTGASGILVNQRAIDKIGLNHLGTMEVHGIGDQGARNGFASVAESCKIDTLHFKTCLLRVVEGKHPAGDEDGLIGTDFFSGYIIHIDFQRRLLHLIPQPAREPNPQGYDRAPSSDEKDFTPIYRYGHQLMVPTRLNGKTWGLFLIDTGSGMSFVDTSFARLSTKVYGDSWRRVRGISGNVDKVFEADKAQLEFATFRQENLGLTSFNLNNSTEHAPVRMSGIFGFPLLSLFRLTIDYRNGLMKFDYVFK
jgi:predicted aspartyl protease